LIPFLLLLIGGITYYALQEAQLKIVEYQAVYVADIVTRQAMAGRSVYESQIGAKLAREGTGTHMHSRDVKGFIPLPVQFQKLVGREASAASDNRFRYQLFSKWNLEPTQGLNTDFQKWAWAKLKAQDQADPAGPIDWQPVWRFENLQGIQTLLYARADPAAAENCVACHNGLEQSVEILERRRLSEILVPKQWKQHQLMGAIQVEIPLDKVNTVVETQARHSLLWIMAGLGAGLFIATWFVMSDFARTREIMRLSWLVSHDAATGFYNNRAIGPLLERLIGEARSSSHHHALCYVHLIGLPGIAANKENDQLLKVVSNGLHSWLPAKVIIVRLHALHFALLIPNCSISGAQQAMDTLLHSIEGVQINGGANPLQLAANIGIVRVRAHTESADHALKEAENACRIAAAKGPNQYHIA